MTDKVSKSYELLLGEEVKWFVTLSGSPYTCDLKLYRVQHCDDDVPMYLIKGHTSSDEVTPWSEEVSEPIVDGFIKWDGCSDFKYAATHFCGDIQDHIMFHEAIQASLVLAHRLLTSADWNPPDSDGPYDFKEVVRCPQGLVINEDD